jgi:hypothetical protein
MALLMAKHFCILNVKDGALVNPKAFETMLKGLKDGKYKNETAPVNQRTLPQNSYLHGILIPEFRKALVSVGYDEVKNDDQAKQIMKSMFLSAEIPNKETGEMIKYVRRTRDLNKEELNILIEEVIKFCAENMNYQIPFPNEQLMMQYE